MAAADDEIPTDGERAPGREALVVFTPSGRRGRFTLGTKVLGAARVLGVDIDSVCGGRSICGRCQCAIVEGHFAKHGITSFADHAGAVGAAEERYADRKGLASGRRLTCQADVRGDLVVDVPPESQVHKQVVRKRAEVRQIELDPAVKLRYVEVRQPDMHEPSADLRRLREALRDQWQTEDLECGLGTILGLQKALRDGDWSVTAAIRDERHLLGLWPGFRDRAYGVAYDVGSTTLAAHLCDLETGEVLAAAGRMNPQIRFGEDLMSRVSYVMMNPGGHAELSQVVRDALSDLAEEVAQEAGIAAEDIVEAAVVGNPIMHHLVLGLDPTELGGAPFALSTDEALDVPAAEIGLGIHPGATAYFLPCIAGHVGADAAGVLLSETPYLVDELCLIVDVGTNAEIMLGNRERMLACSSPTGPAFEGAQISCGQRAAPGAIERVRIDRETLEPRIKVIGCDHWSDQDGFDDDLRNGGVTGICGSGIVEVIAEMYLSGIITADGVITGEGRSPRIVADGRTHSYVLHRRDDGSEVRITQGDVRAIQLAKAALYAGVRLLMDRLGVDAVERITLAGAFGSHIDVTYAMVLGLIPDCDLAKVGSAGNAAGTGARIALLNRGARREIESVVRRVEKVETAVEPRFQEHFVQAMALPHASDPFPNLRSAVDLPVALASTPVTGQRNPGRRRQRRPT